jgi:HEAT repeats
VVRWSKRFDSAAGPLDDGARLALIRDLGFVRGAWCVPLLAQAYEEEPGAEHRRAVLTALAAYRHPEARATFEAALVADDEAQRAIASAALGQIERPS